MNFVRAFSLFGLLVISLSADASMVMGPGGASCVTWSGDRQRNEARSQLNQAWVQGFVTGYGVYSPQARDGLLKPVDSRGLVIWIDNYCDANPLKDISDAAKALIEDMEGRAP